MPRVLVTSGGRPGTSFGCLGSVLAFVLLVVLVAAIALGALVLFAIVGAALVVGLLVFAVDRLLLAISPSRRARRDAARSGGVIDATARIVRPGEEYGSPPTDRRELPGADRGEPPPGPSAPSG